MNPNIAKILVSHGANAENFKPSPQSPHVLSGYVPTTKAIELWFALREQFASTGIWPVIRGSDRDFEEPPVNPAETLAAVPSGNWEELLAQALSDRIESFQQFIQDLAPDCDLNTFISKVDASGAMSFGGKAPPVEPWPKVRSPSPLSIHSVRTGSERGAKPDVRFSLIQLAQPHECPAYLGFGGWNDAPMPEMQVAMLREWRREYGAVPIAIAGDVLECFVERPPQTESESMRLAAQQWLFCDDIVSQGTQTVRALAIEIWRSPRWFFWWD